MASKRVWISAAKLRAMGACEEGVRYFRKKFGAKGRHYTLSRHLFESIKRGYADWAAEEFGFTGTFYAKKDLDDRWTYPGHGRTLKMYKDGKILLWRDDCGCGYDSCQNDTLNFPYGKSYRCKDHSNFSWNNPMPELK